MSTHTDKARSHLNKILIEVDAEDELVELQREHIRENRTKIQELEAEIARLQEGKKIYWQGIGRVVGLCESATDDSEKITIEIENLAWWGEVNANAPAPTTEMVVPQGSHRLGQKVPFEGCKIL